ncbi:hypothetical protein [Neobacillus notoginsengisoli]|nr:hypothetical protein [Neobacillus notoginsengisoli]
MEPIDHLAWVVPTILGISFITSLIAISKKPHYLTAKIKRRNYNR